GKPGRNENAGTRVRGLRVFPRIVKGEPGLVAKQNKEALRVCNGGASILNGYLQVPSDSDAGLYTILLKAAYGSETVGETVNGSYYSQVLVSGGEITPRVSILPGYISSSSKSGAGLQQQPAPPAGSLYEGEQAHVVARVAFPNGTAVKYGEYTALVYPQSLQSDYTSLMHSEYANSELIQLTYDPASQEWLGNVSLPSPGNAGSIAPITSSALSYSGPYDVYVSGLSSDGTPTTTSLSAQQPLFVQPYVFVAGGTFGPSSQTSQLAFNGEIIPGSGSLTGDLFLGTNYVSGGSITISDSQVKGRLALSGANVTLVGVSGGDLTATNSTVTLEDSTLGNLTLVGSRVTMIDSSYAQVSPPLARLSVTGLSAPINGSTSFGLTATGQGLTPASLTASIDGTRATLSLSATPSGLTASGMIDAASMVDGVHTLVVTATQSDGLSSSLTTTFSTNAHSGTLASQLSRAGANITALSSKVAQLSEYSGFLFNAMYGLVAVAVIAVIVGVLSSRRKPVA
ncbi:MAG: hypothetical protein JRN24_03915, partial [Nitrososphaerota archaeon]|nr:hypothetical protein [Nitrososphaerota archaeon]